MTLTTFARMCETLEEQSPSVKQFTVNQGLSAFKKNEKKLVVQILALELPQNNIAQVKATKWLASAFDVVASDISSTKRKWGDLGQAMYYSSFVDTDWSSARPVLQSAARSSRSFLWINTVRSSCFVSLRRPIF